MDYFKRTVLYKLGNQFRWTMVAIFSFFTVSMIMQCAVGRFKKQSHLSDIQFGFKGEAEIFEIERSTLFNQIDDELWFFIPDMFFLITIFWLVSIVFKKLHKERRKRYISYYTFKIGLIGSGIASLIFDWYENFHYIFGSEAMPWYWPSVVIWKESSIGIFLALILVYTLLHYPESGTSDEAKVNEDRPLSWESGKLSIVFRGSIISILMLAVIGLGLTMLDQGATLVVHLLDQANAVGWQKSQGIVQIFMTVMLINLLAVIISHYPEYMQSLISPDKNVRWHIHYVFRIIPGLITFTSIHHDNPTADQNNQKKSNQLFTKKSKYANYVTLFRYYLGVMTYVAWFYVMYRAFDLYGLTRFNAGVSVALWSMLVCVIIYYLYRAHGKDSYDLVTEIINAKKQNPNTSKQVYITSSALEKVKPWIAAYKVMWVVTFITGIGSLVIFAMLGWHNLAFYASILFLLSNTYLYVFFRLTRLYQKYVFFDEKVVTSLLRKDNELAFSKGSKLILKIDNKPTWNPIWKFLGKTSSNYYFLSYMRFVAMVSALYLIWSYFTMDSYITAFSAIPMTLTFLLIVYIIIIYPIKFYMAYGRRRHGEETKNTDANYYTRKKRFIWIAFGAIALVFILNKINGISNLHQLFYVESEQYETVDEFTSNLLEYIDNDLIINDSTITPMLQITSFGGGLKSNLWTLLTMNELDQRVKSYMMPTDDRRSKSARILDYTISLSGVSGGAVGLGNYLFMDYRNRTTKNKPYFVDNIIRSVGEENILAIDVSGLFGHDRIAGTLKTRADNAHPNYDRSYYAMRRYMKVISQSEALADIVDIANASISEFWCEMKDGVRHNPALIINTASTGFKPGVSMSLQSDSVIFPGYIELSQLSDADNPFYKDLRYYDAVSTSNRFPIMSPAGQIENEGFFLDGGYFENSGLLTSTQFLNHLKSSSIDTNSIIEKYPVGSVVILNGKSDYVRKFINKYKIKQIEINSSTNSAAIISGITNIDKLPNVLMETKKTYSETGDSLFTIYLPHPISFDDIRQSLGGDFEINQDIKDAIETNNEMVVRALKAQYIDIESVGIVVPPLARTMSTPAVDYEIAMAKYHPEVSAQLQSIIDYVMQGVKISPIKKMNVSQSAAESTTSAEYRHIQSLPITRNLPPKVMQKNASRKIGEGSLKSTYQNTKKNDK